MSSSNIRLLAAIMFADMVGYTELMQEDEAKAKEDRDRQREVLENCIAAHKGKVIQYYGDGSLSIFGSAVEAVQCAKHIQKELTKDPKIPLRIGLHLGDIVYDDEGAYGDAVNLAARIESVAEPGSILISDRVHDELQGHPKLKTVPLGSHNLKHIKRQVDIYAVSGKGLTIPSKAGIKAKTGGESHSIAVLPFVNMSMDVENEYFSDGITEEIINALTRVKGLSVTSRTSAFAFKGMNKDIREIGAELNVNHLLEGSVRKAGNRIRITAQLINTKDGFHIWSEVFDRSQDNIFEVQDEISKKIAAKLKENIGEITTAESLVKQGTDNIQAYNHYLRGKFYWHKWTPEDVQKSIEEFKEAIKLSGDYAEAYAGLAMSYSFLGAIGRIPPKQAYEKAEKAALNSIKYNENISESQTALAMVKMLHYWDFEGAKKHFKKAISLDPNSPKVKQAYALYFKIMGRNKEAIRILKDALDKDPLSLSINADLARAYLNAGEPDKALLQFNKTLKLDDNFRTAIEGKGWAYLALGDYENALKIFDEYHQSVGHKLKGITQLGYLYGKMGDHEKAGHYLSLMRQRDKEDPDVSLAMDFSVVYLGMGKHDKVFEYFEEAYQQKLGTMLFINTNPIWDDIKADPRFPAFIEKIGLHPQKAVQ